ncbi:hypothetical protein [Polymorphospora rubra]|uniref:Uncharacterized protein n=1 Tax=Polymorphospora rubra TaxID=338584 RepID=A0A810N6M7_9ACTN|nr:hypothetical protein [Polymorphospora rubra]BCJ68640.1 hypothetical protein Prubr_56610 [Polymorphospora rubra]
MAEQPGLTLPGYFEYHTVPVKMVSTPEGGLAAWRLALDTGAWQPANDIVDEILFATGGEIYNLSEREFVQLVEENRAQFLRGDGPVHALYGTMRAIAEVAREERRSRTPYERALTVSLARRTFVMFEEELQRAGDPGADPTLGRD